MTVTQAEAEEKQKQTKKEGTEASLPPVALHPTSGKPPITDQTVAEIERVANEVAALAEGHQGTPADVIARASRIEAGNGYSPKTFTSPRAKGVSKSWGAATLVKLREMHQSIRMTVARLR